METHIPNRECPLFLKMISSSHFRLLSFQRFLHDPPIGAICASLPRFMLVFSTRAVKSSQIKTDASHLTVRKPWGTVAIQGHSGTTIYRTALEYQVIVQLDQHRRQLKRLLDSDHRVHEG